MANFTDQPIQFTPYVETTPVQAMVAVGMQKEQDFKQGIAKVQAYVDTIAGLDIAKEEDKQYVSSKLNEVKEGIAKNLSGDFSDSRITNQIGGAAVHIYKDPIVQNAVISTTNYRKGIADIEAARKAGKSDKNNEDYYYNEANKWLTDKTPGTKFSGSFIEYTDIMKRIRENVSAAGIDSRYVEQMYETDGNGKLLLDKNNHLIPALTMSALTTDSNAKQVQSIVANVLKEGNIQQQIQVDGWANTRNIQPSAIYESFLRDFTARDVDAQEALLKIQSSLSSPELSTEKRAELEKQKLELQTYQNSNSTKLKQLKELALVDPDKFKQNYYQDNYVNNLLMGFSTVKEKQENKENPLRKQYNWFEEMNFKRENENWNRNLEAQKMKNQVSQFELTFKAEHEQDPVTGEWKPKAPGSTKKPTVTPTTAPEVQALAPGTPIDAVSQVMAATENIKTEAFKMGFGLFYQNLRKLNGETVTDLKGKKVPLDENRALELIGQYAKARGQSREEYIAAYMGSMDQNSENSNVPLNAQDAAVVADYKKLNNSLGNITATIAEIYRQVEKETGVNLNSAESLLKPEIIKDFNGKTLTITPSDKMDLGIAWMNMGKESDTALKRIKSKFGENAFDVFDYNNFNFRKYQKDLGENKSFREAQLLLSEKFKNFNIVQDPFAGSVMGSPDEQANARNQMMAILTPDSPGRLGSDDRRKALAVLARNKDAAVTYIANRPTQLGQPWTGKVTIVDDKDGKTYSIDVNEKELEAVTGRDFKESDERGYAARTNVSRFGSTNLATWTTDPNAWQTAAIGKEHFAGLKNTGISASADIITLPDGSKGLSLYYKEKGADKFSRLEVMPPTPVYTFNGIADIVPMITEADIKNQLEKNKKK